MSPNNHRSLLAAADVFRLLEIGQAAVSRASTLIRSQAPQRRIVKADRDLASDIDITAEQLIRDFLQDNTPQIGFVGEEQGSFNASRELCWILDPVDGTINLLHGLPLCAVSLSLVRRDTTLIGIIDLPFFQTQYTAIADCGAYLDNKRLSVSDTTNLTNALVSIDQYNFGENSEATNLDRLHLHSHLSSKVQRIRVFGTSAIELAWTAQGILDACIMLGNKRWDTSAGVLIAQEAGARVLDSDGSRHSPSSSATIAVAPGIQADLMTAIQFALTAN